MTDYLTTSEFAQMARASEGTVRYWRHTGYGPCGFRCGRRVLYPREAVVQWLRDLQGPKHGGPTAA